MGVFRELYEATWPQYTKSALYMIYYLVTSHQYSEGVPMVVQNILHGLEGIWWMFTSGQVGNTVLRSVEEIIDVDWRK